MSTHILESNEIRRGCIDSNPLKKEETPTIEERVTEIEKRLTYLERFNTDGR